MCCNRGHYPANVGWAASNGSQHLPEGEKPVIPDFAHLHVHLGRDVVACITPDYSPDAEALLVEASQSWEDWPVSFVRTINFSVASSQDITTIQNIVSAKLGDNKDHTVDELEEMAKHVGYLYKDYYSHPTLKGEYQLPKQAQTMGTALLWVTEGNATEDIRAQPNYQQWIKQNPFFRSPEGVSLGAALEKSAHEIA